MRLTGYRIEEPIGEGGMATVYRAIQESLERPVALKVLSQAFAGTEEFTTRFVNEGRLVASLNHLNVVTIYDIGAEDGRHFIAMEYLPGGDLRAHINKGIAVDTALEHVAVIADVLATAHAEHVVHRDVKPANVLFRGDGTLVLSDFGIAKHLLGDTELTLPGSTLGSPYYLSPEQARGHPVDGRADIYSLGIVCYEMLTGSRPYSGQSEIDIALKHVTEPVPRLPEPFAALQPLLDAMLAKSPDDRFETSALAAGAARDARETWRALQRGGHSDSARFDAPTLVLPRAAEPAPCPATYEPTVVLAREPEPEPDSEPGALERADRVAGALLGAVTRAASGFADRAANRFLRAQEDERTVIDVSCNAQAPSETEVRRLLEAAGRAVDEHRLAAPEDDCALLYVERVLEIDPENGEAHEMRHRIAERHAAFAYAHITRLNIDEARQHVDRGLAIDPDNPKLKDLVPLVRAFSS